MTFRLVYLSFVLTKGWNKYCCVKCMVVLTKCLDKMELFRRLQINT